MAAVALISVDVAAVSAKCGDGALREAYLAAGARAQDISLVASSFDMFARPVRMLKETVFETNLPIPGQIIFSVLIGYSRLSNPFIEL